MPILQLAKLEKENEDLQMKNSQLQMKNKSLKSELEEAEQQLDESEVYSGLFFIYCKPVYFQALFIFMTLTSITHTQE